ncbi:tyrosine-type recombinase/integrase [Enterovirga aerilata]|uniref:Tyrosine-type recombinase/integrase n=1 Tax=Enterovirga aerilata TaxID=2730920 RepID=A0A849I5Q1_9HYPH|nr:tyrosine-type recombinase/integrase [Enterovirga sp. DB1703]NNM74792.1 tyrosine-type recombinase/integrase [Enterovirga sp. DB1703]
MKQQTLLHGVHVVKRPHADGSVAVHYYHRKTRMKLPGMPGSAEFAAALRAAEEAMRRPVTVATNVSALIRGYCASAEWKRLAESTRANERLVLKAVEDKWGTLPVAVFRSKKIRARVIEWRDEIAEKHPRAADARVGAFARVLAWALDRGLVDDNPLAGIKNVYRSERADLIWLPEHVAAMSKVCGPELRMALALALHTGQRQADILKLRWDQYDGRAIRLKQGKTKRNVYVPCTKALKTVLDAVPEEKRTGTVVKNSLGGVYLKRSFIAMWSRAYKKAGLPTGEEQLHFHDLRGTAVTMLSRAGCLPQEIATITGHSLVSVNRILEVYLSRTAELAESAIEKLDAFQETNPT